MKSCKSCDFFRQLYRRFLFAFDLSDEYYCEKWGEISSKEGFCSSWQPKIDRLDFSKQRFDEIEEDIKFIFSHLKLPEQ